MALSGSFGNTFRNGYRVQLDWEATQNIANNTTTVTARIYLMSLGSAYTITGSSSNKPAYISIDGTDYTHENLNTNLSANQKKLMATSTKTITHNSDGTKSIQIGGSVNVQATLSGVYWYNVAVPTTTVALDTIPRASTISSFPSFTIGNSFTVGVSRASTAFTHTLMLYHGSTKVGEWTGVTTSQAITLTTAQLNTLYGLVSTSATLTMRCYTYNGSTPIGSYTTKTATATVANASTISTFGNFTIGNNISVAISRALSVFTHTISLYVGSTKVCERTGIGTSTTLTLSEAENNIIYNAFKSSTSGSVTLRCYTYHGSNLVRSFTTKVSTASVASSIVPTFTSLTATEVSGISELPGFVQGLSEIMFEVNGALGAKYSTISTYRFEFRGASYTSSSSKILTGVLGSGGSYTASATITDSRGRTATKTLIVDIIPYNRPSLSSVEAIRVTDGVPDPLGTSIKIVSKGSVSSLNSTNTMKYRVLTMSRTASDWTVKKDSSIAIPNLNETDTFSGYPITSSYDVWIELSDKYRTTNHHTTIPAGKVAMSWGKEGIGVGKVWEQGALDVEGDAYVSGKLFVGDQRPKIIESERSLSYPGWFTIAAFEGSSNNYTAGARGLSIDMTILRTYSGTDNEAHKVSFMLAYNKGNFQIINQSIKTKLIDELRWVFNEAYNQAYLDLSYSGTTNNSVYVLCEVFDRGVLNVESWGLSDTSPLPYGTQIANIGL